MANYGTMLRSSALVNSPIVEQAQQHVRSTGKALHKFVRPRAFGMPTDPEAAAVRVVRNVIYFWFYYTLLLWIILFVSLVPRRHLSLVFLVAMTAVALLYHLLRRAFPNSFVLHRLVDRRLVMVLILIVLVVELVLTRALKHLLISLAIGVPIIVVHALFRIGDDLYVSEEAMAAGELIPLVENKERDIESASQ